MTMCPVCEPVHTLPPEASIDVGVPHTCGLAMRREKAKITFSGSFCTVFGASLCRCRTGALRLP